MWNGVENNDLRENLAWALSFGFPITRQLGAKVIYLSTRSQESIGQDTDSIGAAFSIFWWHRRDEYISKFLVYRNFLILRIIHLRRQIGESWKNAFNISII